MAEEFMGDEIFTLTDEEGNESQFELIGNLDINGKVDGIYELDGDKLNIKFSIYSSVIEKKYTYKVDGKTLTLTDRESGEKGTYVKEAE